MKKILIIIGLMLLSTSVMGSDLNKGKTDKKSIDRIEWAKQKVAYNLLDGESARFRNVRAIGYMLVCGEVNAKNRYGAYIGFSVFQVIGSPEYPNSTTFVQIDDSDSHVAQKLCEEIELENVDNAQDSH